ncbi:MAG: 2-oxoglutarate dehydrogenase complex dihydrolipoyllysine-residue succinyltransferase [Pseudomonadales bacterium]|nr:2-oxoglutarate dehydrogenase complex dihydrolipoyllysine-residue succinyltransferase [Pseudomonadales bacterium]MBP7911651.1 2-oxoglutarate dehydrogenase complex dihydrolipoyllysine-residue succinyltransferase [Pseudomonadales bacterium]HQY69395.1 2-oxoglutarate dehydrogenase complex dihydrolipoyllysine-residue succinyltransferase [Pseudomonadales bacterium]
MSIDIKAPQFPESVAEGSVASWHKRPGEACRRDEVVADIETDKVVLEVVAPADGAIAEILKDTGATVLSQEVIARFVAGATAAAPDSAAAPAAEAAAPAAEAGVAGPAARLAAAERGVDPAQVKGSGKGGRVTREDVLAHAPQAPVPAAASTPSAAAPAAARAPADLPSTPAAALVARSEQGRVERRVPMTRLRARVAERLLDASRNTAMLTTFNEVDMQPVMDLRAKYKDQFEKRHNGTRLGFMGFFVRASVEALKRFPVVNASIDGNDVVYHGYQDIGVAVSSDRGLVVPVLRDADAMSFADIEAKIREYGLKARDGKLAIEDITGGTFTITNGGVFGSLLSTPILNPPQTAILGMHKIQDRAVVVNGQVVVRPMMYLALSYDHRLIDGKDAVQFLVAIKDMIEDPARILLDL